MGECSAIYFVFYSNNELSRGQSLFTFFISYFLILVILDKVSAHIFFFLFALFLVVELFLVEYMGFSPFYFLFSIILIAYLCICQEIFLWGFALVLLILFLYLLQFLFYQFLHKEEEASSTPPNKKLFFSLLVLLLSLLLIGLLIIGGDFKTGFHLKILFVGAGALVIHLCFLSRTGWEQLLTSLCYIIINLIIGGVLTRARLFEKFHPLFNHKFAHFFLLLWNMFEKKRKTNQHFWAGESPNFSQ